MDEIDIPLWEDGYVATYRNDLFLKSALDGSRPVFLPSEPKLHYNDYIIARKEVADEAL